MGELFTGLQCSENGLSTSAAARFRTKRRGRYRGATNETLRAAWIFLGQFKSPITLILIGAAILSLFLGDVTDAVIILVIVLAGAGLSFWQEYAAASGMAALRVPISTKGTGVRDGREQEVTSDDVVPGDLILLSAGGAIPGDARLLEAKDLFVNEATLTGETFPVEKHPGELPADTPLAHRSNVLFQGTHVVSGSARALVVLTGSDTELGRISQRLAARPPETEFEHGVRRLGYFLLELTLLLVLAILAVHLALTHPPLESFLFSLALAVGLTPQLLPAIISVNLAHGARRLARRQVIVRRLTAIENFGSMDVLCSDKSCTLTVGKVEIAKTVDFQGNVSDEAMRLARLNAIFETGFVNPIDKALREGANLDLDQAAKLDEIPYDFVRKRISVLVQERDKRLLIVKGATANVLELCDAAQSASGDTVPMPQARRQIEQLCHDVGSQGFRLIAIACREVTKDRVDHSDESGLTLAGFLVLRDPPKPG